MKLFINILLFALIVGVILFFLKKFTAYRCPKCQSRHMTKEEKAPEGSEGRHYKCAICGHITRARF